jgi:hypothetical protein
MPQDKKKPRTYYGDMTESLNKLNTPLTKKEELQAVIQRAKLLKENRELNKGMSMKPKYTGKDMTPVMMVKQYEKSAAQKKLDKPTEAKRIVGMFSMKKK